MLPFLKPGDEVLVNVQAYRHKQPEVGDVVVALHPDHPNFWLIKRVAQVKLDGSCFLVGDNKSESTDSRTLGCFPASLLLGKVTSCL